MNVQADGASSRQKMVAQILDLILCIGFHGLGLLSVFYYYYSLG
jgi:hypothetical protein